jgi:Mrp family chromosome partitioning ATPase
MLFYHRPKKSSFDKIRMQVLSRWLLKKGNGCSIVTLTSRLPREGVTTVTTGLARSFSEIDSGKVLLLSAVHKPRRRLPLLDVNQLQVFSDLSEFITTDRKYGFDTIRLANTSNVKHSLHRESAEAPVSNSEDSLDDNSAVLDSSIDAVLHSFDDLESGDEQTQQLVQELKQSNELILVDSDSLTQKLVRELKKVYDLILVDSGSLNNSNGSFWLLNSDVNILVIDCTRTTRESLEHQRRNLQNSIISIDGTILNKRKFPIPRSLYWLVN